MDEDPENIIDNAIHDGLYYLISYVPGNFQRQDVRIYLLNVFSNEDEAIEWLMSSQIRNRSRHQLIAVSIIKHSFEDGILDADLAMITRAPIFVFNKRSYDATLNDHIDAYYDDIFDDVNPYWITYIRDDGTKIIGADRNHMKRVHNLWSVVTGTVPDDIVEQNMELDRKYYDKFLANPAEYIAMRHRQGSTYH